MKETEMTSSRTKWIEMKWRHIFKFKISGWNSSSIRLWSNSSSQPSAATINKLSLLGNGRKCHQNSYREVIGAKAFCQLVILSTCHFVNSSFCQLVILSTCHFANLSFCQLVILSTCQLVILPTCHFVYLSFCQLKLIYLSPSNLLSTLPFIESLFVFWLNVK